MSAAHDCAKCQDCLHDGHKCCGCYDGVCCRDRANPLAAGHYCKVCGSRLDSAERECPFGCKPARYNVGRMFRGQSGRFVGLAVIEGGCWNA
jgi:hypothetical protein